MLLVALLWACDGEGGPESDDGRGLADAGATGDMGPGDIPEDNGDVGPPEEEEGPRINSIIPNRGDVAGGTRLRVVGDGFEPGTVVRLGAQDCLDVEVVSEFRVECTTPSSDAPGAVRVTVRWAVGGKPAVLEEGFTYFRPVEIRAVEPDRSPSRGGVVVEVQGRGFVEPTLVYFGEMQAGEVEVRNPNRLTARVPAGTPGVTDVVVRNVNGDARLEAALEA